MIKLEEINLDIFTEKPLKLFPMVNWNVSSFKNGTNCETLLLGSDIYCNDYLLEYKVELHGNVTKYYLYYCSLWVDKLEKSGEIISLKLCESHGQDWSEVESGFNFLIKFLKPIQWREIT